MYQLVAQHVIGLGQRASKRQDHTALQRLGHAPDPLVDHPGDGVGLFEVGMRGVQDHWLSAPQILTEKTGEAGVPSLGHPCRVTCGIAFLRVEIDVEVLRLQHLEGELAVLNLVATEVLRLSDRPSQRDAQRQHDADEDPARPGECRIITDSMTCVPPRKDGPGHRDRRHEVAVRLAAFQCESHRATICNSLAQHLSPCGSNGLLGDLNSQLGPTRSADIPAALTYVRTWPAARPRRGGPCIPANSWCPLWRTR